VNAQAAPSPDRRILALGIRLCAVFAFSTMSLFVKLASQSGIRLPEIMFWRQFVAIPVVLAWVAIGPGLASLKTKRFGAHAKRSLIGTTGMFFTFGSVVLLPLAEATTLSFTVPIFATILSALVLHERVGIHRWSAVIIGFIGVLIVIQPGSGGFPLKGALVGLIAAMIVSIISIQIRDLGRTEPPATTAFYFSLLASILLGALHLIPFPGKIGQVLAWGPSAHSGYQWGVIAMTGLAGGLGQIALTASLRFAPVSTVVGMDYTGLIWSTLYGWLIWQVLPGNSTWLGAPIIVASGLYIVWREHRLSIARPGDVTAYSSP
jgi:drug/metabolite transporter (DMT)-like permease